MARKPNYSTPDGIRAWTKAAGFTSDAQAAEALSLPFRTFCRYKANGLPQGTASAVRASQFIKHQMEMILARNKNHGT